MMDFRSLREWIVRGAHVNINAALVLLACVRIAEETECRIIDKTREPHPLQWHAMQTPPNDILYGRIPFVVREVVAARRQPL